MLFMSMNSFRINARKIQHYSKINCLYWNLLFFWLYCYSSSAKETGQNSKSKLGLISFFSFLNSQYAVSKIDFESHFRFKRISDPLCLRHWLKILIQRFPNIVLSSGKPLDHLNNCSKNQETLGNNSEMYTRDQRLNGDLYEPCWHEPKCLLTQECIWMQFSKRNFMFFSVLGSEGSYGSRMAFGFY